MREHPRRRVLQMLGGLTAGSLAGCSATEAPADTTTHLDTATTTDTATTADTAPPTSNPTATGTETTEETETTPESIATEAWTVTSLSGGIRELRLATDRRSADSADGPLYAVTTAGTVVKLGVENGDVRWRFSVAGEPASSGNPTVREVGPALLVVSNTLNSETLRNYVEWVDPATGEHLWTFEEREFLSPVGVVGDVLYLTGEYIRMPPSELGPNQDPAGEGRLHALDLATGEERWRATVPSLVDATVADHGLYVNVAVEGSASEEVVALDHDGTERWRIPGGTYFNRGPVATDDGVLASAYGDSVAAFAPDGTERWRASGWEGGPNQLVATPRRLYVGSEPLVALSRSGTEHWRLDDYGSIVRPVLDGRVGETLYVDQGQAVSAVDPELGTKRWSFDPEHAKYVYARAVVDAGLVIDTRASGPGSFVLLDETTGTPRGEFSIGESYGAVTATRTRVFAGTTGEIHALDVAQ